MNHTFERDDLITIAKRENNTKRSYLYVNPLQGKHIPVSPSLATDLFSVLADKVEAFYPEEKLLIIGFAETATAIGSHIGVKASNVIYYMNTTREEIPGAGYLFFTESHSHATEQRLVTNGLEAVLKQVDRIVFAEDEVTTGNTIKKLMNALQEAYPEKKLKFGIASLLNSMSKERLEAFRAEDVECLYIHHIPVEYRVNELDNTDFLPLMSYDEEAGQACGPDVTVSVKEHWNSRIVKSSETVRAGLLKFTDRAMQTLNITPDCKEVLVLGTEEFMYPAMLLGKQIEKSCEKISVRFHATSRSPIEISDRDGYPLYNRTPLDSLYEHGRRTFVYNLKKYDLVVIVTDAEKINERGLGDLTRALRDKGNTDIVLVKWED